MSTGICLCYGGERTEAFLGTVQQDRGVAAQGGATKHGETFSPSRRRVPMLMH